MTWLLRKVACFSWCQKAKQHRRTCRYFGRSSSTLRTSRQCSSGRFFSPWACPPPRPSPRLAHCWQSPGTLRWFSPLPALSMSKRSGPTRGVAFVGRRFDKTDSHPFSVTEINTLIIPSLLRRDRATGMPRSWTIERNVSALRLSHGNVFWLDMRGAVVMVAVLE